MSVAAYGEAQKIHFTVSFFLFPPLLLSPLSVLLPFSPSLPHSILVLLVLLLPLRSFLSFIFADTKPAE